MTDAPPPPHDPTTLAQTIDRAGFAVVPDYVPADRLRSFQATVEAAVRANGNESVGRWTNLGEFEDTLVGELTRDPEFIALLRGVYAAAHGARAPDTPLIPSLRCLSGRSGAAQSMLFHYDSYVLTAIVPVIIPTEGKSGRLVVHPNTRRLRRTYLANFLDKIVTDNPRAQRRFRGLYERNSDRLRYIDLKPGSLYLFWGYRSVHTNEECDPDKIRSTAIWHYHDPHAGSVVKRLLQRQAGRHKAQG